MSTATSIKNDFIQEDLMWLSPLPLNRFKFASLAQMRLNNASSSQSSSQSGSSSFPKEKMKVTVLTHSPIDRLKLLFKFLGQEQKFPASITLLMNDYLLEEPCHLVSTTLPENPFQSFVDMRDPSVLRDLVGEDYRDGAHLAMASNIAKSVYQVKPKSTGQHGMIFPMNPEILAYAMQRGRGKTVLEIGGALGENSLLMAFSAHKVFMNEIETEQLRTFCSSITHLPSDVKGKVEPIKGSCFEILKKNPKMSGTIDLIYSLNVFHFFNDKEQSEFFKLLKKLLKADGTAIISVNAVYAMRQGHRAFFEANGDATSFMHTKCQIYNELGAQPDFPCAIIYDKFSICPGSSVTQSFTSISLRERYPGASWSMVKRKEEVEKLREIDLQIKRDITKALCQQQKEVLDPIQVGRVTLVTNSTRAYSPRNLIALFEENGFETEATFVVGIDGHLVRDQDFFNQGQQVGIIVKRR